jgi:hypothetical protein
VQYLFFCDEDVGTLFKMVADIDKGCTHTAFCEVSSNGVSDLFACGKPRSSAAARFIEDNGTLYMLLVRVVVKVSELPAVLECLEVF